MSSADLLPSILGIAPGDLINWGSSNTRLLHLMTHSKQPLGRYTYEKVGHADQYEQ